MPIDSEAQENTSTVKSKRPSDSAFKQQRLPAWQPMLTAGTVLPTFFIIGVAFIPVGIALLYFSKAVDEQIVPYTDCHDINYPDKNITCASVIEKNSNAQCTCHKNFTLEKDFIGTVYMYYGLTNYYQNHRRYVKSRDDDQLLGRLTQTPSTDCDPFSRVNNQAIAPCGAIANSLFNDTLTLLWRDRPESPLVPLLRTGIAWPSDKNVKFRNPLGNLSKELEGYAKPVAWTKNLWELDLEDSTNNGLQNEDLIVWMRTAALPNFRKLYRLIDHKQQYYGDGLMHGNYTLVINYRYPVSVFDGTKTMILSTTSLLGGKNAFLGIAYIVVGCICLLLGVILFFIHIKYSKSTTEMINVNPRTSYT